MLTGKCKEDFLKWYENVYSKQEDIHHNGCSLNYMPFSMAYGVYVDFFDSVGIACETYRFSDADYEALIEDFRTISDSEESLGFFKTRTEARQKAIEKANEIYNK